MAAPAGEGAEVVPDLDLPEQDFVYLAGKVDRPWSHFTGRWRAMKPYLAASLKKRGVERPLRVVDVGSCSGYFALQAANQHAIADIVGVEGSVGVGNGTVGQQGAVRQILQTPAVRSHLRHIQGQGLQNCFVAPEVWDYNAVKKLASEGRPIADAMFLLSVVHHIDGVSKEQYLDAGMSHVEGSLQLLAQLLLLAPCHFIELPNPPWLEPLYNMYKTPRAILEAAAKASGRAWKFSGPIHEAEWFGMRYVWVLEEDTSGDVGPMPEVDVQSCPFPVLFRGDEPELEEYEPPSRAAYMPPPVDRSRGAAATASAASGNYADVVDDTALLGIGRNLHPLTGDASLKPLGGVNLVNDELMRETLSMDLDPGLMTLSDWRQPADPRMGSAISAAPMELLLAHLALRDAISEAQYHLQAYAASGLEGAPLPDFGNSESGLAPMHA